MKSRRTLACGSCILVLVIAVGTQAQEVKPKLQTTFDLGSPGAVHSIVFSADAKVLLVAHSNGMLVRREIATGRILSLVRAGQAEDGNGTVFSPDGATGALFDPKRPFDLQLWDVTAGKSRAILTGHTQSVSMATFNHDGTRLATADSRGLLHTDRSYFGIIRVIEGPQKEPKKDVKPKEHPQNKIKIWDVATGKCLVTLPGFKETVTALAFSHDGKRLAVAGGKRVTFWHVEDGKKLPGDLEFPNGAGSIAFSPDGALVAVDASAAAHQAHLAVAIFNASTLKLVGDFKDELGRPGTPLVFSPDSKLLAYSGSMQVRIWDVTTRKLRYELTAATPPILPTFRLIRLMRVLFHGGPRFST